jgi:glycosyltransferase involved in cell wall biosynthesis
MHELDVLLTPRLPGGHEKALLGWLADAVSWEGLRPRLVLPAGALADDARAAGLGGWLDRGEPVRDARHALGHVAGGARERALLLAPGVLHHQAWLTAAAVLLRRRVWLYVPNAHSAERMGYRSGRWRDALLARWLKRVHGFITVSEPHAAQLRGFWGVTAPVIALPNRVRVQGASSPLPAPAHDGRLRVVFAGRFDLHGKGLDWLAQALRGERTLTERCSWHFQGRGPGEAALHALAAELGPHRVQLHGYAPIEAALARADVLLLCSRYEGLPLVALEAIAHGWPVVASRQSELVSLLPPRSTFEFGDLQGLQSALGSLAEPKARRAAVDHARSRLLALLPERRYHGARAAVVKALRAGGPA